MKILEMKKILEEQGIVLSKARGQNFLIDGNIIQKILNNVKTTPSSILEIGPGAGALTGGLIEKSKKYLGIELDHKVYDYINSKYKDKNVSFINKDALSIKDQE